MLNPANANTKILVIDDDGLHRKLIQAIFEDDGYHWLEAPDAKVGFETALEHFPQLLREGARWSGKSQPLRGVNVPGRLGS